MTSNRIYSCAGFFAAAVPALVAALVIAGCGGSGSSSNSAHVRAYNAVPNGGNCTVFVNSGSANGSQPFEQASSYLFLNGGESTFTFTLSGFTSNAYPTVSLNIVTGDSYTAIAYGRADVGATDLRYPALMVLLDNTTPVPSGESLVRIVNAAPDGGAYSVTVGGTSVVSNLAYGTASSYVMVPSGLVPLASTLSTGTAPTINVKLASGSAYTFIVNETAIPVGASGASYAVTGLQDN